mgnify:FL=1
MLMHVFGEARLAPRNAVLLAMPNWGPDGWDVPQYVFPGTGSLLPSVHHCVDDDVVPVEHLDLNAAFLTSAPLHRHPVGGHQFDGLADVVAAELITAENR